MAINWTMIFAYYMFSGTILVGILVVAIMAILNGHSIMDTNWDVNLGQVIATLIGVPAIGLTLTGGWTQ